MEEIINEVSNNNNKFLSIRLIDFNVCNINDDEDEDEETHEVSSDFENLTKYDNTHFIIQMFGLDETRNTASINIINFKPYFFLKIDNNWNENKKKLFVKHLQNKVGNLYKNSFYKCEIIEKKKLYGFDGGMKHKFLFISFNNIQTFNKVKNLWYFTDKYSERKLNNNGYLYNGTNIYIYESNIPSLLRFFHIKQISPSGWVNIPIDKIINNNDKKTNCFYEFSIDYKCIIPLNNKETRVPYKICSFDIEASSSHGDFPIPKKSYKKLSQNIIDYVINKTTINNIFLKQIILSSFGYEKKIENIDLVYLKNKNIQFKNLEKNIDDLINNNYILKEELNDNENNNNTLNIDDYFEKINERYFVSMEDDENAEINEFQFLNQFNYKNKKNTKCTGNTIIDLINDEFLEREYKINQLNNVLTKYLPKLEGDKVTFIGSTFMNYGDSQPYLNHCIVLNTCDVLSKNIEIESYNTEKEVLLAWTDLIQKEDPDIIIGYNIFGFDYTFMFYRAEECGCLEDFLKLSRNKNEICANINKNDLGYKLEELNITIASGIHELKYIKMNGRIQIDLYNYFRREENLTSYKLDYVSGYFIGDYIKNINHENNNTKIHTFNFTGLTEGSFIHLEEIGFSTEYYNKGEKLQVIKINKQENYFIISGIINPDFNKKIRWCLAKDDVSPKEIFNMTNGPLSSSKTRFTIAKYCIQDCNLLHYLLNKIDVITGLIEMSSICSVPISFIIFRGQGIKLTSYVAKKCREKGVLMPVINRGFMDDGFEGAIVLEPKCNLYLDTPIPVGDFSSLYPSSMISENLCPSSKVWVNEFDLFGNLIKQTGEKDEEGNFIYDNLENYEYVNIRFDTYKYTRKTPKAKAEKIISGYKICRYAQYPNGNKAIMPSILEELLYARKTTKKLIPLQTDDFMKNVYDKRQLAYKITANSLYGQCGAKTSTFYEQDVAASTTAIGRLLLIYAKNVVEECYGDYEFNSKYGLIKSKAEYVYGDSVANYTPIYVRKNGVFDICSIEELANKYGDGIWIECKDEGKQEKEVCNLYGDVETWSDDGFTKINRVIRHKLAKHKKMIRILTHTGLVDVTDDHSLLSKNKEPITSKDIDIGYELLHHKLPIFDENKSINFNDEISEDEAKIMGLFFGYGSCGIYKCKSGKKSCWELNNANINLINKYIELCKKVYPDYDWVFMDTIKSSGVYKVSPRNNKNDLIVELVNYYRNKLYYKNSKIIPNEILNGNINTRKSFYEGLYDAVGDKQKGSNRIDQKNQISSAQITWLCNSLGFNTSINTRKDKDNIYRMTNTIKKQRKNPNSIKKMFEIPYEGYVYDLTTGNHHFSGGIGNIVVHNTDSVFFSFNLETPEGEKIIGNKALELSIDLAQEATHLVSKFLKQPHDFEYEKTFMPFCLLSKKRYVGMLYEHDITKCKRKEMGIVLKRRDNAPIVKDIYGGIIDILMKEQDILKAVDFLDNCLNNIINQKYPIEKLIISKSLNSNYKNPKQIAHKVLADRIASRDSGNKPSIGDRIPFVYIYTKNINALQGEKIETPTFIKENKLKINYSFYISNQVMKPVQQVFALVIEKIFELKNKKEKLKQLKKDMDNIKKFEKKEKIEEKIEKLKNNEIKILLFDKYLRETNNIKNGNQSILQFMGQRK
jgi:DNA polymerase elongation subunit (family B)